ncbi:MAG: ABC transporter ATP-binding protein [Beijerinckiaceae bacterium]
MTAVVLDNLVKRYGAAVVVHGVSLTISAGEFVVLVGPSGCGKSTTLRMIAGLEEISDGQLSIGGRVVNDVAPAEREVAMVFQNYALYPHLSVAENIAFGLRIRKRPKDEIARSVAEAAGILSLTELLDRRPADLSGGQRQRVAMGRAIVRHPKVFLFDEPLSNLDAKLRTQMRAEIKRLHKRIGVTSVYVTHDQVEAMTLADRIVVMSAGRIEQIGKPMDLFMNPVNRFVASFIGSPPMNQLPAVIESGVEGPVARLGDGGLIALPKLDELAHASGRRVIVGIRPEHVLLARKKSPASQVACDLDLVEPLGSEALLHATVAGEPFIIKTDTHGDVHALSGVGKVFVPQDRITVFDNDSGLALVNPLGARAS